jgi:hypothetical protein
MENYYAGENAPDTAILGDSTIVLPMIREDLGGASGYLSPFFMPAKSTFLCHVGKGIAFGVGLCTLLYALDWIQLGAMRWQNIVINGCTAYAED